MSTPDMRHLLALVALFTGLAALGSPETARAGAIENALTELAEQCAKGGVCIQEPTRSQPTSRMPVDNRRKTGHDRRRSVTVIIPTLQYGVDRALE
ncbi:hypothetical protein ACXYN8_07830 [Altererythrobacter sp. CAU 1778]